VESARERIASHRIDFDRPAESDATEPPEAHGIARDGVKLLVAGPTGISHVRFADLGDYLRPGDLLVVNNSATLPAAVQGSRAGRPIAVHFSTLVGGHDSSLNSDAAVVRPKNSPTASATQTSRVDVPQNHGAGALRGLCRTWPPP
jgi:S-adenosylmethionine:tRNA ribosyltransferase-isomerase